MKTEIFIMTGIIMAVCATIAVLNYVLYVLITRKSSMRSRME